MPNQPRKGTRVRGVRLPDTEWEAAEKRAQADGVTTSDVIRAALRAWLQRKDELGPLTPG